MGSRLFTSRRDGIQGGLEIKLKHKQVQEVVCSHIPRQMLRPEFEPRRSFITSDLLYQLLSNQVKVEEGWLTCQAQGGYSMDTLLRFKTLFRTLGS